jgi:hypothetical protein
VAYSRNSRFPSAPRIGLSMICALKSQRLHTITDAVARGAMQLRLAHDASPAHLAALDFELRLHQDDHGAVPRKQRLNRGNQQRRGDEARIAHREIEAFPEVFGRKIARVHAFANHDARIVAKLPVELAVPHVDGPNASRRRAAKDNP